MADEVKFNPGIMYLYDSFIDRIKSLLWKSKRNSQVKSKESTKLKASPERKILDVGCGTEKIDGAIGIDRVKLDGIDIIHDLDKYPWADLRD
ncbi:MAG: hypothetical protein ACW98I_20110, partial [Candidatus Hodarchaeales archaeon]